MKCVKGQPDFSFLSVDKLRECERALQNVLFAYERCDAISKSTLEEIEKMRKAFADETMSRVVDMPDVIEEHTPPKPIRKIPLKRTHLTRK